MEQETYGVHDEEFEAVSKLEGRERFEHFVKRISDMDAAYLFVDKDDDATVLVIEDEGKHLPLWPHPRYASAYCEGVGEKWQLVEMDLKELVEQALPDLEQGGVDVAVMPTDDGGPMLTVPAERLASSIVEYQYAS